MKFFVVYKFLFGLLGLSSIIIEMVVLISRHSFAAANFFSFFTIESNLFTAVMFILAAIWIIRKKESRIVDYLRGASTLYTVMTGIIFSVLLSGLDPTLLTAVPWDNFILHYVIPVAVIVDWILNPPRKPLHFRPALLWLAFPIVYLAYSLIRGPIAHWYPYPFLDPAHGGYGQVAIVSAIITVGVVVLALGLVMVSRRRLKS